MYKIQTIMSDPRFLDRMSEIEVAEKDRIYCRHGFEHLLTVARIAYIIALEEKLDIDKEIIYGAALLHDIGRFSELEKQMNHREAGPVIARPILRDAGFTEAEVEEMCVAISSHGAFNGDIHSLAGILYKADKTSRNCFDCKAYGSCNWPADRKNNVVKI